MVKKKKKERKNSCLCFLARYYILIFPFVESTYQHRFDVDGQLVDLEILDTAGKVRNL